jgi:hypothetical protein
MKLKILDVAHHRNGVCGEPFTVVIFTDAEYPGRMVATLFEEQGYCAVYNIEELNKGNIVQGNRWRGDRYQAALIPLIKKFEAELFYQV